MRHDDNCSSEKCLSGKCDYAKAYILPQKYENLFSVKEASEKGTIFKDLFKPYYEKVRINC